MQLYTENLYTNYIINASCTSRLFLAKSRAVVREYNTRVSYIVVKYYPNFEFRKEHVPKVFKEFSH